VYRGFLWFRVDSDDGAWYWRKGEFEEMVNTGMGGILEETEQERADAAAEDADASGAEVPEETTPFSQFQEWVSAPVWTLDADAQLVRLVNEQCDETGVSPMQLSLRPAPLETGYPAWFSEPASLLQLRARFAVLLSLNRRLTPLLPLIDFTVVKPSVIVAHTESILFPSALGRRMTSLRTLAFTRTKTAFWNTVLQATVSKTQQASDPFDRPDGIPELKVNRIQAAHELLEAIKDPEQRFRKSVFGQLAQHIQEWPSDHFKRDYSHSQDAGQQRSFFVKLTGEGVHDNGGPYRAVIGAACGEEPAGPLQFLVPCPNAETSAGSNRDVVVFNPALTSSTQLGRLKLWGRLAGMVLRQDMLVSVSLPTIVWKALTGLPVYDADLAEIDERSATCFRELDAAISKGTSVQEIRFCASAVLQCLGIPDSASLPFPSASSLTVDTARAFRDGAFSYGVRRGEAQLSAFLHGLSSVLPAELLPMFTPQEFQTLLCGKAVIDVGLLKKVAEYEFVSPSSPHVAWFWSVLESLPQEQRRSFLNFVWARSRLPSSVDGFSMNFKITSPSGEAARSPDKFLPTSQVCFFKMILPKYSSEAVLKEKLIYAIHNALTMQLDFRMDTGEGFEDLETRK